MPQNQSRHMTPLIIRLAAFAMMMALAMGITLAAGIRPAAATDAAVIETSGEQQGDGRFLRMGLNKSAVIKLPVAAKEVIVGESTVVDVVLRNKTTAYLFARAAGQTNVFFFDANGQQILQLDLEVTLDTKALKKLIDRSIPGNDIQVDSTGANIVLKGTAANAQQAKMAESLAARFLGVTSSAQGDNGAPDPNSPVVNLLKIADGDQVMLKVKVVELKRSVLKQLGINLEGALKIGGTALSLNNTTLTELDELNNRSILDSAVDVASGGNSIDVNVRALEQQGLATTLAEPTLTAISGAPASFQAGGEFPYRVCDQGDLRLTCEVQFKPYGVSLNFTPTVLSEGRIALNIATEVSELAKFVLGIPSIDTRKAQTSVEMPSGGSMMMAGLIKDVSQQDLKGAPGLKTLPVLGALFSSRQYQANQTELVVIVTAYVVRPVQEKQLATPVDRLNMPTDLQQIFLGRLNRIYGVAGDGPAGVYHGRVGHIVE